MPGQRVGERQREGCAKIGAQPVVIELAPDLIAGTRAEFVFLQRQCEPVVRAEIEAPQDALPLLGRCDQQHRDLMRRIGRPQRGGELQRVLLDEG